MKELNLQGLIGQSVEWEDGDDSGFITKAKVVGSFIDDAKDKAKLVLVIKGGETNGTIVIKNPGDVRVTAP